MGVLSTVEATPLNLLPSPFLWSQARPAKLHRFDPVGCGRCLALLWNLGILFRRGPGARRPPRGASDLPLLLEFMGPVIRTDSEGDEGIQISWKVQRDQPILDRHRQPLQEHVVERNLVPPTLRRQRPESDGIGAD